LLLPLLLIHWQQHLLQAVMGGSTCMNISHKVLPDLLHCITHWLTGMLRMLVALHLRCSCSHCKLMLMLLLMEHLLLMLHLLSLMLLMLLKLWQLKMIFLVLLMLVGICWHLTPASCCAAAHGGWVRVGYLHCVMLPLLHLEKASHWQIADTHCSLTLNIQQTGLGHNHTGLQQQ
jgi:hypothetical protein